MMSREFSERELEVLRGITEGLDNSSIGRRLYLADDTVKTHVRRLFQKLGVASRTSAAVRGLQLGLVEVDGLRSTAAKPTEETPTGPPPEPAVTLHACQRDATLLASAWLGDRQPRFPELVRSQAYDALVRLVGSVSA